MKIAVFGVTGKVGINLIEQALARGIEIKALVRTPEKLGNLSDKIEIIQGNYFDKNLIYKTIDGVDAVISTIGPPVGRSHNFKAENYRDSLKHIYEGMTKAGIKRFINVTGAAISLEQESLGFTRRFLRLLLRLIAPLSLPAKQMELDVLINSDLDWTSFRPTFIVEETKGQLEVSENSLVGMKIKTEHLTNLMLDNLTSTDWIRKAPIVGTR